MTAQSKKTEQKRLHSCVLPQPKWAKIHEKLKKRASGTLKIAALASNATTRLEKQGKVVHAQAKPKLLGKYQLIPVTLAAE
jgi:hypothetical protein